MSAIQIKTAVPGPKSQALTARRQKVISKGLTTLHPLFMERASGATLTDVDGNTFIDFTGGIGAMNIGHARPELVAAAKAQAERFSHVAIQVNGYEPYVALAERLCELAPIAGDKKAFICTTGTEAVENAIKFARAHTKRTGTVVFEHAFHGRSLGALSFTSKAKPYKAGFGPFLPETYRLPYPTWYRHGQTPEQATAEAKQRIAEFFRTVVAPSEVAAVMLETVLGEGGFLAPPPGFLQHLREVCTEHGMMLIIDEVQCGFARTGKLFAVEHFGVEPDLITMAKSMAGGYPVAAVVGRANIVDSVEPGALGGTYAGNPIACAAALAAVEVIVKEDFPARGRAVGERLANRLRAMQEKLPVIGDVRGLGAMMAIELVKDRGTREPAPEITTKVVQLSREKGLLLLPTGTYQNVIRFLMPLAIPFEQLDEGLDVLEAAIRTASA